jgi:hypothetical protein
MLDEEENRMSFGWGLCAGITFFSGADGWADVTDWFFEILEQPMRKTRSKHEKKMGRNMFMGENPYILALKSVIVRRETVYS